MKTIILGKAGVGKSTMALGLIEVASKQGIATTCIGLSGPEPTREELMRIVDNGCPEFDGNFIVCCQVDAAFGIPFLTRREQNDLLRRFDQGINIVRHIP